MNPRLKPAWRAADIPIRSNGKLQILLRDIICAVAVSAYWINSPHFWIVVSVAPQGMIGTEDVEFFGDPSISLSE